MQSFRAGSISHYGRLNIYGSPINSPERSFPRVLKAVEGKPFVVHCPVAGFPIQDVEWFKGNVLEVALYLSSHSIYDVIFKTEILSLNTNENTAYM